ncbi:MAG: formylglycine-generating enzyme family protein, partial [Acidobacteriota bacterium]|nr:formylglycine-generating enzyme family protein [Acidobacteriota bacterium]
QWQTVTGKLPNGIPPDFRGADFPVINVSWRQANDFCQKLSARTGKTYRLPSEAEWEYAAKAGTDTPFSFGKSINSNVANFMATVPYLSAAKGEYRQSLISVGSLRVLNGFGLADMHGNVWEWTADNWSDDYSDAPTDGSAWETDDEDYRLYRVIRGGSWDSIGNNCRSSHRRKQPQTNGSTKIGFRVVMQ